MESKNGIRPEVSDAYLSDVVLGCCMAKTLNVNPNFNAFLENTKAMLMEELKDRKKVEHAGT